MDDFRARVRGCLLGGAVGDALGWPVEFLSWPRIAAAYGPAGVTDLPAAPAEITDDTQMTLFTVEGLLAGGTPAAELAGGTPAAVHAAYLRWLATQRRPGPPAGATGLAAQPWLYARRAPGNACLSGLDGGVAGTPAAPRNPDSKGCGAVMRSAPFGLDPRRSPQDAFDLAAACATQTHGHPSGYLAAGALAALVRRLLTGASLPAAVSAVLEVLDGRPGAGEVAAALRAAGAAVPLRSPDDVERLGGGWVAEEALAIGVACALTHPTDARRALLLAVNHSGDSDSTGAICGNLLGAAYGESALPADWVAAVEGRAAIGALADAFVAHAGR